MTIPDGILNEQWRQMPGDKCPADVFGLRGIRAAG